MEPRIERPVQVIGGEFAGDFLVGQPEQLHLLIVHDGSCALILWCEETISIGEW